MSAGTPISKHETLANLIGANEYYDPILANQGRSVFGFFEKGILKLEPGNDPLKKVLHF